MRVNVYIPEELVGAYKTVKEYLLEHNTCISQKIQDLIIEQYDKIKKEK